MYVRTRTALTRTLDHRRQSAKEISSRRDDYIRRKYGIDNFSGLIMAHLHCLMGTDQCTGLLCRHVASAFFETVVCYYACELLGLRPAAMELCCDSYLGKNPEKLCLVKQPWIMRAKKGTLVKEFVRPCRNSMARIERQILERIQTDDGQLLVETHHQMRDKMYGDRYPFIDLSLFIKCCLRHATNKPRTVFVEDSNGMEKETPYNDQLENCRPPACWYYPLYLCLFIDGVWALLDSFDDPTLDNKVPYIFRATMTEIKEDVGYTPLVIEIPCDEDMLFYPRRLIDEGLGHIQLSINGEDDIGFVFREVSRQLSDHM